MPEPLTFDITLPNAEWISIQASPSQAAHFSRVGGYNIRLSRPIVAEDFRDFGQRCDLGVLGYSSRDFRREPVPKGVTHEQTLNTAYHSLGLRRVDEYERIALASEGTNGIPVEIYEEHVNALDEAVLEVYRRRAVV